MKKIYFNGNNDDREPFWKPWGVWGWIWRTLLFFILIFLLMWLISMFRSCDDHPTIPEDILHPRTDQQLVPIDTVVAYDPGMNNPGPYLPPSDDNRFQPIDPDDIIDGFADNRLNVILDDSLSNDEMMKEWSRKFKECYPGEAYQVIYYDNKTKLMQLEVPDSALSDVYSQLPRKITDISFKLFKEEILNLAYEPSDPVFSDARLDWFYAPIQAYEAWNTTKGDRNIKVAIVDSYFDLNHYELNSNRIVSPYSIERKSGNVAPQGSTQDPGYMHGTAVATLSIGNMNNNAGACGVAPGCSFIPISVGSQLTSMKVLEGILYAMHQGADVINISIGGIYPQIAELSPRDQVQFGKTHFLEQADVWEYVGKMSNERNVTLVWAAGNEACYAGIDPSKRFKDSVVVAAVNPNLQPAEFTNYGNFPDLGVDIITISAPGQSVFSAVPGNTFDMVDGTSFAAPIVTGAVALMKSVNPSLSNAQIISILKETGKPVANGNTIGKLLQINSAVNKAKNHRS